MRRFALLALCLAFAGIIAWLVLTPPAPRSGDSYSATRAMADVRAIAQVPHPAGSAANAAVRDYLLRRMTALGLSPRVLTGAHTAPDGSTKPVHTLIGVRPGPRNGAPPLALMAHYDSTARGPGAGDDAAGVAAILEVVASIAELHEAQRDVIVILTDGEEDGLLGAKTFFAEDPLAARIGLLVNVEARGSRGRAMMFETGRRNGDTVRYFARNSSRPLSNSLMVFVYEKMPNGTDFTIAKEMGLQGLNFAFLGGAKDYHAATDTPENLDQRSLQDLISQVGEIAGERTAPRGPAPDLAYSDVFGLGVIAYPPAAGWAVFGVSGVLLGVGWLRARRRGEARIVQSMWGAGLSLGFLLAGAGLMYLTGLAAQTLGVGLGKAAWTEAVGLGLLALLTAGFAAIGARLGAGGWTGVIKAGMWAGLLVQILAPLAAPVVHWPLLIACLAAAVTGLRPRGRVGIVLSAAASILGAAFLLILAHQAYLALLTPLALAPAAWLALPLLWPLVPGGTQRRA